MNQPPCIMVYSETDHFSIVEEMEEFDSLEVIASSVEKQTVTFTADGSTFDVSFSFVQGDTKIKVTSIVKDGEDKTVPFGLSSGNYDELVAELLFHLGIINEDTRDYIVYGMFFD